MFSHVAVLVFIVYIHCLNNRVYCGSTSASEGSVIVWCNFCKSRPSEAILPGRFMAVSWPSSDPHVTHYAIKAHPNQIYGVFVWNAAMWSSVRQNQHLQPKR